MFYVLHKGLQNYIYSKLLKDRHFAESDQENHVSRRSITRLHVTQTKVKISYICQQTTNIGNKRLDFHLYEEQQKIRQL